MKFIIFRQTKIQIQHFEAYLNILFDSVYMTYGFSKKYFLFLFPNIPFLITEKLYEYLLKKEIFYKNIFNKKIFVYTFLSIMYRTQKYLFKLFIDFFNYTIDSIIYSDNIYVIFNNIHHYNGNSKIIFKKKRKNQIYFFI